VILGIVVAALWGSGDFLAAMATRQFRAFPTLVIAQATELALCTAIWAIFRPSVPVDTGSTQMLLLAGVLTAASYGALYRGLMLGPIMLVGPIASAYAAGPVFLAVVFLHERLSMDGAVGAATTIAGVVVVSAGQKRATEQGNGGASGVPFGLISMVGFATSAFMIAAFAHRMGWFPPLLFSRVGVAVTLAFVAPWLRWHGRRHLKRLLVRRPVVLAALAGLSNLAGTALYAYAGQLGIVAVVSAVSAIFPVVPVAGGIWLFRERAGRLQMGGVAMIVAGLVLLR
jgi:drug/metabolite transporter (DMT)-like permease